MKAILLASAMTLVLFGVATLALRYRQSPRRAAQLLDCYLGCLLALAVLWRVTPDDLGFLPAGLLTVPALADFAAMVFVFSAAFFGGILQLYILADRGFSLRILVDLLETGEPMDAQRLVAAYSRGQGTGWMYRKRIEGILGSGLARREGERLALTERGAVAAAVFAKLRAALRLTPANRA